MTAPAATKKIATASLTWAGERAFDVHGAGGDVIRIGAGNAPGPVETLLGALAACTCYDVLDILDKRRTPPTAMRVETIGERANAVPARVVAADMVYHIDGDAIGAEHAVRAVQLAVDKYCSVKMSLDPAIPVTWRVILNGTDVTP
jgi:putative redox protein